MAHVVFRSAATCPAVSTTYQNYTGTSYTETDVNTLYAEDMNLIVDALEAANYGINPKELDINHTATISSERKWLPNTFYLGDGTTSQKTIQFETADTTKPQIFWDPTVNDFRKRLPDGSIQELGGGVRSATLTVAASDASAGFKALADYVCDGTDDQVEIQAALNSLPSGGGKIVLSEGIFHLTAAVKMPSHSALEGQGFATVLFAEAGFSGKMVMNEDTVAGNEGIIVRNLCADGNKANQTANVSGIGFLNSRDSLIEKVEVRNCRLVSGGSPALTFDGGSRGSLIGCYVHDNEGDGAWINATGCLVSENIFIDNDYGVVVAPGGSGTVVNNNICTGSASAGINPYNDVKNVTIVGNYCYGNGKDGIWIRRLDAGKRPSQVTVQGNIVVDNSRFGIHVEDGGPDIAIVGNITRNNGQDGMRLGGGSATFTVAGNVATSNCTAGTGKGEIYGSLNNSVIANNLVYNGNRHGIHLYWNAQNNLIMGNFVKNCGQEAANTYDGIFLSSNCARNKLLNNLAIDTQETPTQRWGINLYNSGNCVLEGNYTKGNASGHLVFNQAQELVKRNVGYTTSSWGSATLSAGAIAVNVAHGLADLPTVVVLTPTTDTGGKRYWVSNKTTTGFTISIDSAHTADLVFDWYAEI